MQGASRKRTASTKNDNDVIKRSNKITSDIEVICRVKPYRGSQPCLLPVDDKSLKCIPPTDARKRDGTFYPEKTYEFGYVFDESDGQQNVFNRCTVDLIGDLITGKNGLLFTYGVTGSGKTYTMTGKPSPDDTGILPRTLDVIFNSIDNKLPKCVFYSTGKNTYGVRSKLEAHLYRKQQEIDRLQISTEIETRFMERLKLPGYSDDYTCSVFVSYIEIYNNYCYDLLEQRNELTKRDLRADARGCSFVEGASEVEVENSDEALEVFCRGEERRRTSDTLLNKESARSHSVFTIRLVMSPIKDETSLYPSDDPSKIVVSQLCLVDLAGSERAKRTQNVGDRLAEASNINKSLLVLRRCFDTLRKNQKSRVPESVPYREAKLTQLFKNYFEGGGKIRMIICANPTPEDYEENLNVLSFAEESQTVQVTKCVDRLEVDENRPPVPRRFYVKWCHDVDENTEENENGVAFKCSMPPYSFKDHLDSMFSVKWKNYFTAIRDSEHAVGRNLAQSARRLEPTLRSALCIGDYMSAQCTELKTQQERDSRFISELNAQNKQMKRELQSMAERLRRYEENDEEMVLKEEQMRRSIKEERTKLRMREKTLQGIQDVVEGSPTVAQLTKRFADQDRRKATPTAVSQTDIRRPRVIPENVKGFSTPTGPGYFNPKYQRRSKSASRVLDHQPLNRVPTGGILKPSYPSNVKHVTAPSANDLRKSSEYVITHQDADKQGNLSTSVFKGNVIPTAGGGRAVLFDDVERLTHENLKENTTRSSARR